MEKEEACSLRQAMEDMELKDQNLSKASSPSDDQRIYEAALNEASELVWQHQHPGASNPTGPYRYRPHLRKNSYAHARTASVGMYGDEIVATGLARDTPRSVSGSSAESAASLPLTKQRHPNAGIPEGIAPARRDGHLGQGSHRSGSKRNISGEIGNPFSVDQIWEEPEAVYATRRERTGVAPPVLGTRTDNPLKPASFFPQKPSAQVVSAINIHLNPPSRSRDPQYTTNTTVPKQFSAEDERRLHGVEIRGDDIRQATSMRLGDRSEKLPTPTAVSDDPTRPIVSFDTRWSPADQCSNGGQRNSRNMSAPSPATLQADPRASTNLPARPPIPTISLNDEERRYEETIPKIQVPALHTPSITVDDSAEGDGPPIIVVGGEGHGTRPLPTPGASARRPRCPRPPITQGKGSALCHECGHYLQGRFVALAGSAEKFHPQCLTCFSCGTSLEALEISPEPDSFRRERLERINRRMAGEILEEAPGKTMAEDGDDRLRFYCHLDWHELFAPKCKHCKTPILGEHIVALGEHWHYGHFFCAECGDPFEHGMTHIEKDGYAWCISCQTKRTERRAPKCRKCKLAVVGQYVQALGSEWHETCFLCAHCEGTFDDGQIFPKENTDGTVIVLCTSCRASELKQ